MSSHGALAALAVAAPSNAATMVESSPSSAGSTSLNYSGATSLNFTVIERKAGAHAEEAEVLEEMGAALERAGDWAGAIDAYHRLRRLQDTMAQTSRRRALLEMQERFDNEGRTRELALLQREGELHDAQLRAQARNRWLWTAAALACGLALAR